MPCPVLSFLPLSLPLSPPPWLQASPSSAPSSLSPRPRRTSEVTPPSPPYFLLSQVVGLDFAQNMLDDAASRELSQPPKSRSRTHMR